MITAYKLLKYAILLILFIGIIVLDYKYYLSIRVELSKTFDVQFSSLLIRFIITTSFGLLLGLDSFIGEFRKIGIWKVDIARLIILGIPSLFFSFSYILAYTIGFYNVLTIVFLHGSTYLPILFGYTLLNSFKKVKKSIYG